MGLNDLPLVPDERIQLFSVNSSTISQSTPEWVELCTYVKKHIQAVNKG